MQKVQPHQFFRLDFDQILTEAKRQEDSLAANVGEFALVKKMHAFFSENVLTLIRTDDWVFDAAYRFATEYALECIRLLRLTGTEVYETQQKLTKLKEEVYYLVALAKIEGYIDNFGQTDLEKMSDFKGLLNLEKMPKEWVRKVESLYEQTKDHEEIHVTVALRSIRDLYETDLPRIMYVVKRAIKLTGNIARKPSDDDLIGISDDLSWYSSHIPEDHALSPIFCNLRSFYKPARNVANHHKGYHWNSKNNKVILEDENHKVEISVTEFLQKHRYLVHFCDLGVRGILAGFAERECGEISNKLVIEYAKIFPRDWQGGEQGIVKFYD